MAINDEQDNIGGTEDVGQSRVMGLGGSYQH